MREVSYQALVIPTKLVPAAAGSGNPVFLATSGFWIPASADFFKREFILQELLS